MSTSTFNRTEIEPVHLGPTWEPDPQWREGDSPYRRYILPERTLGWQQIAWVQSNLLADDSTPDDPKPFMLTFEQRRFLLWWYAVDDRGVFLYRDGVLQRLKGWLLGARTRSPQSSPHLSS